MVLRIRQPKAAPPPEPAPLEILKPATIAEIEERYARVFRALTEDCPAEERDTWEIKRQAAARYGAGEATPSDLAMFAAEVAYTGETVAELVATISAKSDAYVSMIGALRGLHRKAMHAVADSSDHAGIDAALATLDADTATFLAGVGS